MGTDTPTFYAELEIQVRPVGMLQAQLLICLLKYTVVLSEIHSLGVSKSVDIACRCMPATTMEPLTPAPRKSPP